jgi:hypothetical protein
MRQLLVWGALLAGVLLAAGCASEEPVAAEETATAKSALSPAKVADILRSTKKSDGSRCFSEAEVATMVCIAQYESGRTPCGLNKCNDGTIDRGLFQINSVHLHDNGCPSPENGDTLYNPVINAQCACTVYRAQGFDAWVAYGQLGHKAECDSAPNPGTENCKTDGTSLVCGSVKLTTDSDNVYHYKCDF